MPHFDIENIPPIPARCTFSFSLQGQGSGGGEGEDGEQENKEGEDTQLSERDEATDIGNGGAGEGADGRRITNAMDLMETLVSCDMTLLKIRKKRTCGTARRETRSSVDAPFFCGRVPYSYGQAPLVVVYSRARFSGGFLEGNRPELSRRRFEDAWRNALLLKQRANDDYWKDNSCLVDPFGAIGRRERSDANPRGLARLLLMWRLRPVQRKVCASRRPAPSTLDGALELKMRCQNRFPRCPAIPLFLKRRATDGYVVIAAKVESSMWVNGVRDNSLRGFTLQHFDTS